MTIFSLQNILAAATIRGLVFSLIALALFLLFTGYFHLKGSVALNACMERLAAFLFRRGLFETNLESERTKIDILRIATGAILILRTLESAAFLLTYPTPIAVKIICIGEIVLASTFTFGFFTPFVALVLLFFNVFVVDASLATYTLGSDVLSMMLLVFAFGPAGTALSLDALIVKYDLPGRRLVRGLYSVFGHPSLLRFTIAKWAMLLCYCLLCLYSVLIHVFEHDWRSGDAAIYLLSSPFMSRYPAFFQHLFSQSLIAVYLAKLAMIGMIAWYFYLLPFVLIGGWFRRLAIGWMILFFIFSMFLLNLSWLAYYEFVFLAILFWQRAYLGPRGGFDVFYDDRCNLCDRTVRTLVLVDVFRVLHFKPLSRNGDALAALGVSQEAALQDLYGFDSRTGVTYSGYGFYIAVAKRLLLLAWLLPFALLGKYTGVGPAVYRFVAAKRILWFGVCRLSKNHNDTAGLNPFDKDMSARPIAGALFASFFFLNSLLAVLFIVALPNSPIKIPGALLRVAHVYGFAPIDVFNHTDLHMSTHWFTIETIGRDGKTVLAPITARDGTRLAWQSSDVVYFGNTLSWRRERLVDAPVCYSSGDDRYLDQQFAWAARAYGESVAGYRVSYYYQPLPAIWETPPYLRVPPVRKVCSIDVGASGRMATK